MNWYSVYPGNESVGQGSPKPVGVENKEANRSEFNLILSIADRAFELSLTATNELNLLNRLFLQPIAFRS